MQVVSVCFHSFNVSPNIIWLPFAMAKALEKKENKVQIDHLHWKHFHTVKRLQKLVQYSVRYSSEYASFFAVSYQKFTNELCQLWRYYTKVQKNLCDRGIAVNMLIKVAISHSVSKWQSNNWGEFAISSTKLVVNARHLTCRWVA